MKKFMISLTLVLTVFSITFLTGCSSSSSDDPVVSSVSPVTTSSTVQIDKIEFDTPAETQTFTYNASGFITGIVSSGGSNSMAFEFDAAGNLTKRTRLGLDAETNTWTYTSDGKLLTEQEDSQPITTYDTWSGYNPTHGTDSTGEVTSTYNSDGTLSSFTWADTSGVEQYRVDAVYTSSTATYTDQEMGASALYVSKVVIITYDTANKITNSIKTNTNSSGQITQKDEHVYTYNTDGNVSSYTFKKTPYSGGTAGTPVTRTATVTYKTGTGRPSCNDLIQDKGNYAQDYLL